MKRTTVKSQYSPFLPFTTQGKFVLLAVLFVGGLIGWFVSGSQSNKIVYIHTEQVFASFDLTKELDAKLSNTFEARRTVLDNLDLQIQSVRTSQTATQDSVQLLQGTLAQKHREFSEDHEQQRQTYHERILTQINQYAKEFQEEQGYDLILGANGSGGIMAAQAEHDVTEAFIEFINRSYQGK
ncbi:MAG: OmpH family outer membrane protein [Bacteroidota bacterium]